MEGTSASLSSIQDNQNATASTTRYQVFINHRGPDVKRTLADLIYHRLHEKGLQVFLDKDEFQPGQPLNPTIEKAIRTSSVHIAIFSEGYAESDWCLKELRLMLETGAPIIPVFYGVQPSDLRWIEQGKGKYVSAFDEYEKKGRFDSQTISAWKSGLSKVSYYFGLDFCKGKWGQLLTSLEDTVFQNLKPVLLHVATHPVGLDEAIREFESFMESEQKNDKKEVKIVGIVGLGGSGKTTLAKEFFNRKSPSFQRSTFLFDVRDAWDRRALPALQNKLLQDLSPNSDVKISSVSAGKGIIRETLQSLASRPRVLIILDDIGHEEQADALLVKDVLGSDSLVIITSRDAEPLRLCEASIYKINALSPSHAQRLFCNYAFNQPCPIVGFEDLVQKFCEKCGGLPLFLKVIGAHLRVNANNDQKEWQTILEFIPAKFGPKDISKILNVTYNPLSQEEKHIFLDIACFFLGEHRDLAIKVWDTCEGGGSFGLNTLMNKCLVELDDNNCFKMHDLVRDFGRDIANKETPCRLWNESQAAEIGKQTKVCFVMNNNFIAFTYSNAVRLSKQCRVKCMQAGGDVRKFRGIIAATCDPGYKFVRWYSSRVHISSFKPPLEEINLSELKFLAMRGDFVDEQIGGNLANLVWFRWFECPYPSISRWLSSMENLTVLELFRAKMEEWPLHGEQVHLRDLKIVETNLISIPESVCPCLEHLDLRFNRKLMEVNQLPQNLVTLKLEYCTNLEDLKGLDRLEDLRELDISECCKLRELPALQHLSSLETLYFTGCTNLQRIQGLKHLPKLRVLKLVRCSRLRELPTLQHLLSLETLNASKCTNLQHIQGLENLSQLQALDVSNCSELRRLPTLQHLHSLQSLDVSDCTNLQHIQGLGHLTQLRVLNICGCSQLRELPTQDLEHLSQLRALYISYCSKLRELPALQHLRCLRRLHLSGCTNLQHVQGLEHLPQLRDLDLFGCCQLRELPTLQHWPSLETLDVSYCTKLRHMQGLEHLPQLRELNMLNCSELRELPTLQHLSSLERLDVSRCANLQHIQALEHLPQLRALRISECAQLGELPTLQRLPSLDTLNVYSCTNLRHMQGLKHLSQLREVSIRNCSELRELPTLQHLGSLDRLYVFNCNNLQHIQGLECLPRLRELDIGQCFELRKLPILQHLPSLETLNLRYCSNLQRIEVLHHLPELRALKIYGCPELRELPTMQHLVSLETLNLNNCSNLQDIQGLEHLSNLQTLDVSRCFELRELPTLGHLHSSLVVLKAYGCTNLRHIQGLEHLRQLRVLCISGCSELQQLPNLERVISLKEVEADGCWKLQGIQGLDQLQNLESLTLSTADSRAIWNATQHMEKLPRRMCLSAKAQVNSSHTAVHFLNIANLRGIDLNTPERMDKGEWLLWAEVENPPTSFILCPVAHFPKVQPRLCLELAVRDENENDPNDVSWRTIVEEGEWVYAFFSGECNFSKARLFIRVEDEESFCNDYDDSVCEVKSLWMATGGEEEMLGAVKKLFVA